MNDPALEPGGQGEGARASREELRQQARAIGGRWPIDPSVRMGILRTAVGLIEEDATKARLKLAAMKVILAADRLNLEDRRLELVEQRLGEGEGDQVDADLVEQAARVAAERKARPAVEPEREP